jgi:transcriptional regulator with GAF, ATPase, and Fis domain
MNLNKERFSKILENFDFNDSLMFMLDIANIDNDLFNKKEKLLGYKKLSNLKEDNDDFSNMLSNFAYSRYRELRSEVGSGALMSFNTTIYEEDEDEKSRDAKEIENKKKSEEDEKEFTKENEKKKKAEQNPLSKALRTKGHDQDEAAEKLDVDKSTISRIKTGTREPSFELMKKMSDIYGKGLVTQLLSKA